MRNFLSLLTLIISLSSCATCAAPAPGVPFNLKVLGGNAISQNVLLRDNNTYFLGVSKPPYADGIYGDNPLVFSISTQNATEIIISPTAPHPGPISGRLALVENAPNDWVLSKAFPPVEGRPYWNIGKDSESAIVTTQGLGFAERDGRTVLVWSGRGRWVIIETHTGDGNGKSWDRWIVVWIRG